MQVNVFLVFVVFIFSRHFLIGIITVSRTYKFTTDVRMYHTPSGRDLSYVAHGARSYRLHCYVIFHMHALQERLYLTNVWRDLSNENNTVTGTPSYLLLPTSKSELEFFRRHICVLVSNGCRLPHFSIAYNTYTWIIQWQLS
jgi:hypothetical protein